MKALKWLFLKIERSKQKILIINNNPDIIRQPLTLKLPELIAIFARSGGVANDFYCSAPSKEGSSVCSFCLASGTILDFEAINFELISFF